MTTDRTAIRRRLAVRRAANRPPRGGRKSGHRHIVAPLAAALAATVVVGLGVAVAMAERERRGARERLPGPERRFGLRSDETAAHGLRRIVLGQLDDAIELLRGESSVAPDEAVHETRKALKRLRALMRLLEGELGPERAARERGVLSDVAGRLAGARDAKVMVSTLEGLMRRHPRTVGRKRGVLQLREHLRREHRAASAQVLGDAASRELIADELCALRARVAEWQLRERSPLELVGEGLQRIYSAGRARRKRAAARKPARRALHKWRKEVKDLRYSLEAIDVQGRSGTRAAKLAARADGLGEMLGEEHDLMVLGELVRAHRPLRGRRRARKQLLRAIARRRARLRERALREGRRLYERPPKRFVRRLRA